MPNAASIASAVAAGKISARELLDVSITCIASTDRRVNAFTDLTLARAQKEADAVDAQCARWRQHSQAEVRKITLHQVHQALMLGAKARR